MSEHGAAAPEEGGGDDRRASTPGGDSRAGPSASSSLEIRAALAETWRRRRRQAELKSRAALAGHEAGHGLLAHVCGWRIQLLDVTPLGDERGLCVLDGESPGPPLSTQARIAAAEWLATQGPVPDAERGQWLTLLEYLVAGGVAGAHYLAALGHGEAWRDLVDAETPALAAWLYGAADAEAALAWHSARAGDLLERHAVAWSGLQQMLAAEGELAGGLVHELLERAGVPFGGYRAHLWAAA